MSTFTPVEVEALENGGNKRARKTWLASFEEGKSYQLDPEDPNNIDKFMQMAYVDKVWCKPLATSAAAGAAAASTDDDDKKKKDKKRKDSSAPDRSFTEATFPSGVAITTSAQPTTNQPPPKPQAAALDLGIDFLSNLTVTAAPAPAPAAAPFPSQPAFDHAPQSNAAAPSNGALGLFDAAPIASSDGFSSSSSSHHPAVDSLADFFRRLQQQHGASYGQLTGWVQKALANIQNESTQQSTATQQQQQHQRQPSTQQQPQLHQQPPQDAFADIEIPADEEDTGNPFDSSDDEDESTPGGAACQTHEPHTHALARDDMSCIFRTMLFPFG